MAVQRSERRTESPSPRGEEAPAAELTAAQRELAKPTITKQGWTQHVAPAFRDLSEESKAFLGLLDAYVDPAKRFDSFAAEDARQLLVRAGYGVPLREIIEASTQPPEEPAQARRPRPAPPAVSRKQIVEGNAAAPDLHFEALLQTLAPQSTASIEVGVIDIGFAANDVLDDNLLKAADRNAAEGRQIGKQLTPFTDAQARTGANHGTHVAGIATGGTSRIKANLFAIAIPQDDSPNFEAETTATKPALLEGLREAIRQGSKVINVSIEFILSPQEQTEYGPQFKALIESNPQVLFVFGAGNDFWQLGEGSPTTEQSLIELFKHDHVVVVGASNPDGGLWRGQGSQGSNFGKPVDVAARGHHVMSADELGGLGSLSGTSQAAPRITNLAAKCLMLDPTLAPSTLKELMIAASNPHQSWVDLNRAGGTVDGERLLNAVALRVLLAQGLSFDQAADTLATPAAERAGLRQLLVNRLGSPT